MSASEPLVAYCQTFAGHREPTLTSRNMSARSATQRSSQRTTRRVESPCARGGAAVPARKHTVALRARGRVPRRPVDCGLFRVDVSTVRSGREARGRSSSACSASRCTACSTASGWTGASKLCASASARSPRTWKRRASEAISKVPMTTAPLVEVSSRRLLRRPRRLPPHAADERASRRGGRPSAGRAHRGRPQRRRGGVPRCGSARGDDLRSDGFDASLGAIEAEVKAFADMADLAEVEDGAARARSGDSSRAGRGKAQLFNSREALFERDMTEYTLLAKTKRASVLRLPLEDCAGLDAALRSGWLTGPSSTLTPRWSSSRWTPCPSPLARP